MNRIRNTMSILFVVVILMSGMVSYATTITPLEAANYAGKTVTVEGKILRVGQSKKGTTFFLNFSATRGGFTAVIFDKAAQQIKAAGTDILSLENKTAQVTGKVVNDPQYGLQIVINASSQLKVVASSGNDKKKESKTGKVKASETMPEIKVTDIAKYADQIVIAEGKVAKIGTSTKSGIYFLNFDLGNKKEFTVVIFKKVADQFKESKIDIKSFEGKNVQVTGQVINSPQYGLEIILDIPDHLKLAK